MGYPTLDLTIMMGFIIWFNAYAAREDHKLCQEVPRGDDDLYLKKVIVTHQAFTVNKDI